MQDTPYGSARLALAARTSAPLDDGSLTLVWSTRGAAHLHRSADLPRLAAALWPLSDADAAARITSSQVRQGARLGLAAFTATAKTMHAVVTVPLTKGEVSAAVSARIPESLVTTYLRLLGPATPGEAAKFLGTTQAELRRVWPDSLVEVHVDGRRTWLPQDQVDALYSAPPPRLVRLLPPSDPFLQARDRVLLVLDATRHAALWRVLGNPSALLVDGEITGIWRARMASRAKLEVTVTPFNPLLARTRAAVEAEAAAGRAARDVRVRVDGSMWSIRDAC
ncbi:MAG: DNA glycosylase AlkZ-like family protein, partial [Egibacteraceae bacterium]